MSHLIYYILFFMYFRNKLNEIGIKCLFTAIKELKFLKSLKLELNKLLLYLNKINFYIKFKIINL